MGMGAEIACPSVAQCSAGIDTGILILDEALVFEVLAAAESSVKCLGLAGGYVEIISSCESSSESSFRSAELLVSAHV